MTIQWTTTKTTEQRHRLRVCEDNYPLHSRDATPADVIAAIETNAELREAVVCHMTQWDDRDEWKERAEKAEENYRFMVERAADQKLDGYRELGARLAASEEARDAALSRLREAERERDEARADAERLKGLYDTAIGLCHATRSDGVKEREKQHQDALGIVTEQAETIARLERELEALNGSYNARVEELSETDETIAKLERELAEARADDEPTAGSPVTPAEMERMVERVHADALELRARRALDEWEKSDALRSVSWRHCKGQGGGDRAFLFALYDGRDLIADSHVDLARRLGLLGGEGAGEPSP